jgi:regulator of protease activity HflC (stomatin/prohibitin superfamily)
MASLSVYLALAALPAERERISRQIREIIDEATDPWGIEGQFVEFKDVILAENRKRVIARQAEAERERRAVNIQAEGELEAAQNMADAASTLNDEEGAFHLRTLQTLNSLSSDDSNTVVFAVPAEALRALERIGSNGEAAVADAVSSASDKEGGAPASSSSSANAE